jgi:hypothetical protein
MTDSENPKSLETQIGVILERIDGISKAMAKLDSILEAVVVNNHNFMTEYATSHAILEQRTSAAHKRIDDITIRLQEATTLIGEMQKILIPLVSTNKILSGIAAAFGVSVIGLIWALVIGQVQLVFP